MRKLISLIHACIINHKGSRGTNFKPVTLESTQGRDQAPPTTPLWEARRGKQIEDTICFALLKLNLLNKSRTPALPAVGERIYVWTSIAHRSGRPE